MSASRFASLARATALSVSLALSVAPALAAYAGPTADEAALRALIERYFTSWSAADIGAYGETFHEAAVVFHVARDGTVRRDELSSFLRGQRRAHAASPGMREFPLDVDLQIERGDHASAVVHWELVSGSRTERGYDHFRFLRTTDGWKVLSIVFYSEP